MSGDAGRGFINVTDQPSKGGKGVPDAEIAADFHILVEVKMPRNSFDLEQMDRHFKRLESLRSSNRKLFFLTSDEENEDTAFQNWKASLSEDGQGRIRYITFIDLKASIETLMEDDAFALSDIEIFLLKNLMSMFENEGLLGQAEDTVIVAAGDTYEANVKHKLYVCQPGRSFRRVKYLGFYNSQAIKPEIMVLDSKTPSQHVRLAELESSRSGDDKLLAKRIRYYISDMGLEESDFFEGPFQVFLPKDMVKLEASIPNTLTAESSDRRVAYTQGQRYAKMSDLKAARTTSDLVS